jgi:hypothetical protein
MNRPVEVTFTEPPGQELQYHVVTGAGGARGVMFHGHGAGELEHRKDEISQFFHRLDRELHPFVADQTAPLVLAGVDDLLPLHRETTTHPRVLPEQILGNPESRSVADLASRAWEIVRSQLQASETVAVTRYHELGGSGRGSADLATVVWAAHDGRVAEVFVVADGERRGTFAPGSGAVSVREGPGAVGEDLLNLAAIYTFQRGGTVHVLERGRMPGGSDLAAIFRYWRPSTGSRSLIRELRARGTGSRRWP